MCFNFNQKFIQLTDFISKKNFMSFISQVNHIFYSDSKQNIINVKDPIIFVLIQPFSNDNISNIFPLMK